MSLMAGTDCSYYCILKGQGIIIFAKENLSWGWKNMIWIFIEASGKEIPGIKVGASMKCL